MRHDDALLARAAARADVEAEVMDVLDSLTEEHDGDWPTLNALDLVRFRLAGVFASESEDDDE